MARNRQREEQQELPLKLRGGKRAGAGRKPRSDRRRVPHGTRSAVSPHHPLHVTVRIRKGLPSMRQARVRKVLNAALRAARENPAVRLVHFSIQSNHLHLLVEAQDRASLSRGMQGLLIRISKALNRLWDRRGSVFYDRFHSRSLRTPREVRNALVYVLQNARKHGVKLGRRLDLYSSALWFDGWRGLVHTLFGGLGGAPVQEPRSWLLRVGWRRHGLIDPGECPRLAG